MLNSEEVVRFLKAVPGLNCRVALTAAYATGMRVSEVIAVQVRNIGSGRMVIRIERVNMQNELKPRRSRPGPFF